MTIAAVLTVRNEEKLLRSNLLYHHFLGVDHFFIYVDRCEDGTVESICDLPFVEIAPMPGPEALHEHDTAKRLRSRMKRQPTNFNLRITANAFLAAEESRRRGWDWLIHIDADELICIDRETASRGQLADYLNGVAPCFEVVRFRAFEVCQRRLSYESVFAEETLFKTPVLDRRGPLSNRILRRLSRLGRRWLRSRNAIDPLLLRIQRYCNPSRGSQGYRQVFDPFLKRQVALRWYYGHVGGKVAARLSADVIPRTPHDFERRDGEKPCEETTDHLLHYFAYSFENFLARARIRPHFSAHRQLFGAPKSLFVNVVNQGGLSPDELEDFYARWVLFDASEVDALRRSGDSDGGKGPQVVEITAPKNTFSLLDSCRLPGAKTSQAA